MFSATALLTYVAACFLFLIVPGPSVSIVVANSLARGTKAGLLTILGSEIAMLSMVFVVALGLQAVMTLVASAFVAIKLAGAAYLVWIGWRMVTSSGNLALDKTVRPLPAHGTVLQARW